MGLACLAAIFITAACLMFRYVWAVASIIALVSQPGRLEDEDMTRPDKAVTAWRKAWAGDGMSPILHHLFSCITCLIAVLSTVPLLSPPAHMSRVSIQYNFLIS